MASDAFGTWEDLGTVTPAYDRWDSFFPSQSSGSSFTFRATFSNADWNMIHSYCWLRISYTAAGSLTVSKNYRLYASQNPVVFSIPKLLENDFFLQVQRRGYSRYKGIESLYSVKIEVKILNATQSSLELLNEVKAKLADIEAKINSLL